MGAGVCVLASDAPENCEVISDAGFTFRRGDVEDLQRMLKLLLCDARLRSVAAEKARARVQESYLWDSVAEGMEQIYVDLKRRPRKVRTISAPSAPDRRLA
jgi:glycosyltransferase involved in cell wall biosynthesis